MLQLRSHARRHLPNALLFGFLAAAAVGNLWLGACSENQPAPAAPAVAGGAAAKPAQPPPAPAAAELEKPVDTSRAAVAEAAADKSSPAPEKPPAPVEHAKESAGEAAAKVVPLAAEGSVKATPTATDAPQKTASVPVEHATPTDAAATQKTAPVPDPHAGHDHPPGQDHAVDAAKGAEGSDVIDPNSKAKLTYEFESDSKKFGKVMQGDVLTHKFQLVSSGEEDLIIKQAKPTCGCTVAQIAAEQADGGLAPYAFGSPIPPGRKVEISATLHTQNKRGHASSRINIFSNDPRGQTQLSLEADVEPFFQINPNMINFNTLSAKDTKSDKLSVSTTKGERVKLVAATDNVPQGLKVELNPLDADAEGKATRWELAATAGPGLIEGNLAFPVLMKSDLSIPGAEKTPTGSIPTYEASATVMARVTGMISYNPAFVSFGLIRPGQVVSKPVRITSHDPDFKIGEPKVIVQGRDTAEWEYAKYFSSVVRPAAGENAVDVEVRLDGMPETLNGSFTGTLILQIGHPEKPELKLPITGVCRGGAVAPVVAPASQPQQPATKPN